MSNKWQNVKFLICMTFMFGAVFSYAQVDLLHGDQDYSTYGVHSGNKIRTSFWNDGQIGYRNPKTAEQVQGEWPINSGHDYIAKISSYFGSEVRTEDGIKRHIVSEANGSRAGQNTEHSSGDASDEGDYWSMTPLPGFYEDDLEKIYAELDVTGQSKPDQAWVAMSHKDWSWPETWPDKMDDPNDPGWHGYWNGYFGKDFEKAADQESYYVMDDYNNIEFDFYPDSMDHNRRGLGLRVTVRGMQWSQAVVEDALFWLFNAENIGTHLHDKMGFGVNCGPNIGNNGDTGDDNGSYDLENDLAYQFDEDYIGGENFSADQRVGLLGLAFLETPGNPYDGIDNDGDGADGPGPTLTEADFTSRTVNAGDDIIAINYNTFERTQSIISAEGFTITYLKRDTTIFPGELIEIPQNLIDDNLNGIIDENNGRLVGSDENAYFVYLNVGLKYIDYFTGNGSGNPMIDERRDDGIDNNNDWNPLTDDVGLDGLADTGDEGEGDGVPTSGFGTDRPGEPNIDKTDIDESDQIGLTSFILFDVHTPYQLYNDERLWSALEPGYLDQTFGYGNTDIMMGSAYFPLAPDEIKQLSLFLLFGSYSAGQPTADLVRNKIGAQAAYRANYQFAKAPPKPTVSYTAEDGKITLYWDDIAESANDPLTGKDFEGYRIYRSTDPGWKDMEVITDAYGVELTRLPMVQFDLVNGISGLSQTAYGGVQFNLGDETGIVHKWVDSTVVNGRDYWYAVTSYDHGADSIGIYPTECSKYLAIKTDGSIERDENVVLVRAEAPSAGFTNASVDVVWQEGSTSNASVVLPIENSTSVQDGIYQIVFEDTLVRDRLWDIPYTKNFSVIDVTNGGHTVLIDKSTDFGELVAVPEIPGIKIMLENKASMNFNADSSSWNNTGIYNISVRPAYISTNLKGTFLPADYRIEFGSPGMATSTALGDFESSSVNFKVINTTHDEEIEFAFQKRDGEDPVFSAFTSGSGTSSDRIYFLEKNENDSLIVTIQFELSRSGSDSTTRLPGEGDIATIKLDKPFLSNDVAEFTTKSAHIDNDKAETDLDNIKVVPNPYIVSNSWEPMNPYSSGRGPRELHFTHLPKECTIKIFNIQGQLVRTLEHSSTIWDGTEIWDMLTKDKLDIAYGIYIYHIEAPRIGEKIGKFAVIK